MALVEIMQGTDQHPSARVAAAKEILDRGEGKVKQEVDAALSGGFSIRWATAADEILTELADD